MSEKDVISFFSDKVAKWQIPDAVVFVDELPRNATGKVLKNKQSKGDTSWKNYCKKTLFEQPILEVRWLLTSLAESRRQIR